MLFGVQFSFITQHYKYWLFIAVLITSACAPETKGTSSKSTNFTTGCLLNQDQSASFMYRWKSVPIPLSFRSGHFNTTELNAAIEAAETWNQYFRRAYGINVFDYGSASSPRSTSVDLSSSSSQLCGYSAVDSTTGQFRTSIMIFKRSTWPSGLPSNAVAVTSACKNSGTTALPLSFMAMMEINFQNFYNSNQAAPDLESIFLHELGHLLGLDHTCASQGKQGHIACSAQIDQSYFEAVMYPSLGSTMVKQVLNKNDQGRASCLYGPAAI